MKSTAKQHRLPVNTNYKDINVELELMDATSHLNIYKAMIVVRNSDPGAFDEGGFKGVTRNNILAFSRTYNPDFYPTYVMLANFNQQEAMADFSSHFEIQTGLVYLSTGGNYKPG